MEQHKKTFEELLSSLSLIATMDSGEGVLQTIAEYYGLEKYSNYFDTICKKALSEEFLTDDDIQEIITMQNAMIEEILLINTEQASQIEEALQNL